MTGKYFKQTFVACFKKLSQHLPVTTKENHIMSQ